MGEKNESNNKYQYTALTEVLKYVSDQNKRVLEPISLSLEILQKQINESVKMSVAPALKAIELNISSISYLMKDLYQNPEGVLNFFEYMEKLDGVYWSMPFKMNGEDINKVLVSSINENKFDANMSRYFSKKVIFRLFEEIYKVAPKSKLIILRQIQNAFENKNYQLINGPIISLIDDTLSVFLVDKSVTSRIGIFLPILEDMEETEDWFLYVFLNMLSNNISTIFQNIDLDKKINISKSKKISRHAIHHGRFLGNNRRIESIMLLNTLYNSLIIINQLKKYHNRISFNRNKGFELIR